VEEPKIKQLLAVITFFPLLGPLASAQTALVTRNVNLRPGPSINSPALATLKVGTQVQLLDSDKMNRT
jgi:uncharacterized protein YraI